MAGKPCPLNQEKHRLVGWKDQLRSWSEPVPVEETYSLEIILDKSTWSHMLQTLYLLVRVLSLDQPKKKFARLQEVCKKYQLHNTLVAFRVGKNTDPNSISFLLSELRTKLFVRRRKNKDDIKRTLKLSGAQDRQPVTLHILKDNKRSQQLEPYLIKLQTQF